MFTPGPRNLVTDVAGLAVGHAIDEQPRTGGTAVLCGGAWTAAVDVFGIGLRLRPDCPAIPIVPAAVLHDLANGGDKAWGLEPPYRPGGVYSDHATPGADRHHQAGEYNDGRQCRWRGAVP